MAGLGHWYIEMHKQAFWRGSPHVWANRYILSGADPSATDAATVIDALHGIEDVIHIHVNPGAGVGFVAAKAYASTGGPPFLTHNYNASLDPATATGFFGSNQTAGASWTNLESSLVIRTPMQGLSSTGKTVYNRKYIRGWSYPADDAVGDQPMPAGLIAFINSRTLPWTTGMGSNNYVVIGKHGRQSAGPPQCEGFTGNRQVPKGRKRKKLVLPAGTKILGGTFQAPEVLGIGNTPELPVIAN